MRKIAAVCVLAAALAASSAVQAGHEPPIYPSYYPQEIRIEAVDPAAAARLLPTGKLHAYVGRAPDFAGPAPPSVRFVESLGSFLVVRLNPDRPGGAAALNGMLGAQGAPPAKDTATACAAMAAAVGNLAGSPGRFTLHPYPVNGFHADYLHHADLAEAARARLLGGSAAPGAGIRIRADGELAKMIRPGALGQGADWDAAVEEIDRDALLAGHAFVINGTVGPPWLKSGWFHAYLLLASSLTDPAHRERAAALAARLKGGSFANPAERINAERGLVQVLTAHCQGTVAAFAAKREYYTAEYSEGVENIAFDSHTGLNSAIFIRTVKLKDFPWNGWLRLGVPSLPAAAWNPFGGFNDEAGRLIWWALGDPGLFADPYSADWVLNRFGDVKPAADR